MNILQNFQRGKVLSVCLEIIYLIENEIFLLKVL